MSEYESEPTYETTEEEIDSVEQNNTSSVNEQHDEVNENVNEVFETNDQEIVITPQNEDYEHAISEKNGEIETIQPNNDNDANQQLLETTISNQSDNQQNETKEEIEKQAKGEETEVEIEQTNDNQIIEAENDANVEKEQEKSNVEQDVSENNTPEYIITKQGVINSITNDIAVGLKNIRKIVLGHAGSNSYKSSVSIINKQNVTFSIKDDINVNRVDMVLSLINCLASLNRVPDINNVRSSILSMHSTEVLCVTIVEKSAEIIKRQRSKANKYSRINSRVYTARSTIAKHRNGELLDLNPRISVSKRNLHGGNAFSRTPRF